MATLSPTLNDHDFRNWVKGGLGLKFAREGIVVFVETNIDKFHEDVIKCLPAGQHCDKCSTENTISCKSNSLYKYNNNFCKLIKNNCTVHDPKNPSKKGKKCPNSVCFVIRDEIVDQHRFNGPSWRNTDSSRWCREPWQLATCYMPEGYKDSSSSSETDFPGLLSIVINNKVFNTVVTASLKNTSNVFVKARETRNEILHNVNMRMSDADLARHITVLDDMLSDTKCLAGHPRAVKARALLTQIQNDTLSVSTLDADGIRADALKAIAEIAERKKEALESIDAKEVASKSSLRKMVNTSKGIFQLERKEAVTEIHKERQDAVSAVHQAKEESKRNAIHPLAALFGNWLPKLAAEVVAPVIKSVSEYANIDARDPDYWNVADQPTFNSGMENWMSRLPGENSLAKVAIPGTHDSMARKGNLTTCCQSLSLTHQLKMGIRFFDIRCRHFNDDLPIHHGMFYQKANFKACVRDMVDYLKQHDEEIIIMRVKEEYEAANNTKPFADAVDEVLNGYADRCWMENEMPKLWQVRGKIIILQDFDSNNPMGIKYDDLIIADGYKKNHDEKLKEIKKNLEKDTEQLKLTFSSSTGDLGMPTQFARSMNTCLITYVADYQSGPCFGIIAMDFPGPNLVADIVKQNFC